MVSSSEQSVLFFLFRFYPAFLCLYGWMTSFVCPYTAQQSLPLLSCMLVRAYHIHIWGSVGGARGQAM